MRPSRHLALSTVAGGAVWAGTGEPWALPVTVGAGVLIDVDHSPDLWWSFALDRKPVSIVFLHAWEWLAGLVVAGIIIGFPWWLIAVTVGAGAHVVTDGLFNGISLRSYSLVYRSRHRFDGTKLSPGSPDDDTYRILEQEVRPAILLIRWWKQKRD